MKFGCCCTYKNYNDVAKMSFDYMELSASEIMALSDDAFLQLTSNVQQGTLPILGFNDYCKNSPVMVGDAFDEEAIRKYANGVMSRGAKLGIKTVGVGAPSIRKLPKDYSKDIADQQSKRFLEILLEEAKPYALTVLFESVHQHMCDYCTTFSESAEIVKRINNPALALVADFYHLQVMEEPAASVIPVLPLVRHIHISGCDKNYGRPYPSEKDIPYLTEIMWILNHADQEFCVSLECNAADFHADAKDALHLLKRVAGVS